MKNANPAMSVADAIAKRRSVRSYTAARLDRETINMLLAAAIQAPTAIHEEQWAFVVVQGDATLQHLSELVRIPSTDERELVQAEASRQAMQKYHNPEFNIFYGADTLILICAKSSGDFVAADCWLAAENLILAACAMGLGSCVIGSAVGGLNTRRLKAELGIPEEMTVIAPIILGVPKGDTPISQRTKPLILSWTGKPTAKTAAVPPAGGEKNLTLTHTPPTLNINDVDIEPPSTFDRMIHASMARATLGISPASLALAYFDWAVHLAVSPGKCTKLIEKSTRKWARLANYFPHACSSEVERPCIEPLAQDQRFRDEAWQRWPFNLYSQAFLLQQQWWHNATTGIAGVSAHDEQVVSFVARQLLDMMSPVNFIATNPLVSDATIKESGKNLLRGLRNIREDLARSAGGKPPLGIEEFQPGGKVASTPGKVVFRNRLIELIQYSSTTEKVNAEPVLIVPAWIMKYYILDLSETNSLVRYLIDRGHTVFMISWHNAGPEDRDLEMEDYMRLGVLDAFIAIQSIVPDCKVNTVGYCLGGTLLAITAAYLAREGEPVINSVTLLAAQTDFTEAGELTLFIDNSQLSYLEDMMWDQGYLDTKQMAGAFQLLQSNDLIWSQMVQQYLMGQRRPMNDLMAWNADATRLPYRMHSEYLRSLFLNNDLFEGRYQVDGRPVALGDIQAPMFVVATEKDHVAPWRSVYKIMLAADTDVEFVLTSGGHNAGIVSEPGHIGRHFRHAAASRQDNYVDPDTWLARSPTEEGSWWPVWGDWLSGHSTCQVDPPALGAIEKGYPPLEPAPGSYDFEH